MSYVPEKLLVVSGAGTYPAGIVRGARAAGVPRVDVLAVRGSTARETRRLADTVHTIGIGEIHSGLQWCAAQGYDGAVFAGQISPLSLFRSRFDAQTKAWLASLPCKNAHTVYGKLAEEFEKAGIPVFPASIYMDRNMPGEGTLTRRSPDAREMRDIAHAAAVAHDVGVHDVGQTVAVKDGMVLAVEAFEGTNAAIKRAGRLGGRGAVVFKAAREGHDMRFDIPVIGPKTVKTLARAKVSALAFQAHRPMILDIEKTVAMADARGIAIAGVATGLPPAPLAPSSTPALTSAWTVCRVTPSRAAAAFFVRTEGPPHMEPRNRANASRSACVPSRSPAASASMARLVGAENISAPPFRPCAPVSGVCSP